MSDTPIFDEICRWMLETRGTTYSNIFDDAADLRPIPVADPRNLEPVFPDVPANKLPTRVKGVWLRDGVSADSMSDNVITTDPLAIQQE